MLNYPTGCLWKTLVKFAIMKKIVSTILIAIVVCLSMSGQDNLEGIYKIDAENTGNFYIEDSKLFKSKIISLLEKDVFGYFDLYDEYPTELKQSVFKKSKEYANYLARLEEDYAFLMSSEYRIDYNLKHNKPYDVNNKCFIFEVSIPDYKRISLSGYVGLGNNINTTFPVKYLKTNKIRDYFGALIVRQYLQIPLADEETALKIETDMDNPYCSTCLVFVVKLNKAVSEKNSELFVTMDNILLKTVKLYIMNTKTGEIYCDLSDLLSA